MPLDHGAARHLKRPLVTSEAKLTGYRLTWYFTLERVTEIEPAFHRRSRRGHGHGRAAGLRPEQPR
jgi:hypothetical protein